MLSKRVEFNLSKFFRKNKSDLTDESELPEEMDAQSRRLAVIEKTDLKTVVSGFTTGFFIAFALGALILSIGFVI